MLYEIAVPEMAIDTLTYSCETHLNTGARVIVEVQKSLHAGFVAGPAQKELDSGVEIKPVKGVINDRFMTDLDLWDLAEWAGKVCMCGINTALRVILPKNFYMGEKLEPPPDFIDEPRKFEEIHKFNPFDSQRVKFYCKELERPERTLVLLPTKRAAIDFYSALPKKLKSEAMLWPFRKDWDAWRHVNSKRTRIVVGAPGAVFAPLCPEKIIVDNESESSYILPYGLKISARSLAGRRAHFLGASLILGGRLPSLKTYMRSHPPVEVRTTPRDVILADIYSSRKEETRGVEGVLPLTFSLIRRTYRELLNNSNVMWILNRQGKAQEVFCEYCGHVITCEKCGLPMRSINDGEMLRCPKCGALRDLPAKCEECGREFFKGRRPGLESLAKILTPYYPKVRVYVKGSTKHPKNGLILTTNFGLEMLNEINPSLVAWLDIDTELRSDDYETRLQVFGRLFRCMYAGKDRMHPRKVLIQGRRAGIRFAEYLSRGWDKFLADELKERADFMLPPCGYMIELDSKGTISREELINILEDSGLFVMDPGDESKPLSVSVNSLDEILPVLAPYNHILNITVRSE